MERIPPPALIAKTFPCGCAFSYDINDGAMNANPCTEGHANLLTAMLMQVA